MKFNEEQYNKKLENYNNRYGPPPSKEDYYNCQYRSPEGLKCAIGCLIPDEIYSPAMENKGCYTLLANFPGVSKFLGISLDPRKEDIEDRQLLVRLQHTHDSQEYWKSTQSMRERLKYIAEQYNLDSSIVDTLSFKDR